VAVTLSLSLLPINAANTSIMDNSEQIRFPMKLVTKSKNSGRSVDHHFQNGAVTVSLSLSPVIAANTLVMHTSKQIASQVTYLQDKQSLTLR